MNDMGEKHKVYKPEASASKEANYDYELSYPRETFSTDQLPELSDVKLGDRVRVTMDCEVVGVRSGSEYPMDDENKDKTKVTLEMKQGSCKMLSQGKKENMGEKEDMEGLKKKDDANDFGEPEPKDEPQTDED